jgi:5'-nucleotidase
MHTMAERVIPASVSRRALVKRALGVTLALAMARRINPPAAGANGGAEARVRLLSINDFHGGIEERTVGGRPAGGAAALAAHLALRRAGRAGSLTVHAGDMIGASPPISALRGDEPSITSMELLGVELGCVGNHEFDRGPAALLRLQGGGCDAAMNCFGGAGMQYLAANVIENATAHSVLPPYAVRTLAGVPVGFIGCTLKDTPTLVTPAGAAGLAFLDEVPAINRYAAELQARGVNAIVALVHQGGSGSRTGGPVSGAEINRIAGGLDPAVRVIVSGHTHRGYQGHIGDKLVTQAFSYGTALADLEIVIDRQSGRIVDATAEVVTTYLDSLALDPAIVAQVRVWQDEVRPQVERVVGEAATGITRLPSPAGESALGNLIADAQRAAMGTQMAFVNPGGIRDDLLAGPITWGRLFQIQPFANDLVRMTLAGAQIERLLNLQWRDPEYERILKTSGVRYAWSAADPNRYVRLDDVFLADGTPLKPGERYTVAVNSFLAAGGDGFTVLSEGEERETGPVDLDALVGYIESSPRPISARIEGRIVRRGTPVELPGRSATRWEDRHPTRLCCA